MSLSERYGFGLLVRGAAERPDDLSGDERDEYEERAAIMEHDGGLPRAEAERRALARVIELRDRARTAGEPRRGAPAEVVVLTPRRIGGRP